LNPKKSLKCRYFFPSAIQQTSPLSSFSKRFNQNKPYDAVDLSYLKSKLHGILKEIHVQDKSVGGRR
jgi:hypothetical protein